MRNYFNYEFLADRSDLNPEEEAEFRQHVREIIEESKADNPDGLSIPDIYERLRQPADEATGRLHGPGRGDGAL